MTDQQRIAELEAKIAQYKAASTKLLERNKALEARTAELEADIAKMAEYGENVFAEIEPLLPKKGKSIDMGTIVMKALPKLNDPKFMERIYNQGIEPLFGMYAKYKKQE